LEDQEEKIKLDELDEEEYDALPEAKKDELEKIALSKRKERIKRLVCLDKICRKHETEALILRFSTLT